MSAAQLVAGYSAYTDAEELGRAVSEPRYAKEPTTTVLTTSVNCGD